MGNYLHLHVRIDAYHSSKYEDIHFLKGWKRAKTCLQIYFVWHFAKNNQGVLYFSAKVDWTNALSFTISNISSSLSLLHIRERQNGVYLSRCKKNVLFILTWRIGFPPQLVHHLRIGQNGCTANLA